MLRFGKERSGDVDRAVQFGAPTGAELLADCTAHAIRTAQTKPEVAGLYHLIASGTTTWFDHAQLVFAKARGCRVELAVTHVNAVPTSAFPTPTKRPHNSRLDTKVPAHLSICACRTGLSVSSRYADRDHRKIKKNKDSVGIRFHAPVRIKRKMSVMQAHSL